MLMTTLDHLAIETEGQLSPLQVQIRELRAQLVVLTAKREKERRRWQRLRLLHDRCITASDKAGKEIVGILSKLKELEK